MFSLFSSCGGGRRPLPRAATLLATTMELWYCPKWPTKALVVLRGGVVRLNHRGTIFGSTKMVERSSGAAVWFLGAPADCCRWLTRRCRLLVDCVRRMPLKGPVKIGVDWVRAWNVERGPGGAGGGGEARVLWSLVVLLVVLVLYPVVQEEVEELEEVRATLTSKEKRGRALLAGLGVP